MRRMEKRKRRNVLLNSLYFGQQLYICILDPAEDTKGYFPSKLYLLGTDFDNLVFGLHDSGNSGDSIHIIIGCRGPW